MEQDLQNVVGIIKKLISLFLLVGFVAESNLRMANNPFDGDKAENL